MCKYVENVVRINLILASRRQANTDFLMQLPAATAS